MRPERVLGVRQELTLEREVDYVVSEIARELGRGFSLCEDIAVRRLIEDHTERVKQLALNQWEYGD